jgi:hypothetical protein
MAENIKIIIGVDTPTIKLTTDAAVSVSNVKSVADVIFVATGARGPAGETGPAGVSGDDDRTVVTGDKGDKGATGAQGIQGISGVAGTDGETGTRGVDGVDGVDGATGDTGANGTNGIDGVDGTTGNTGDTGADGTNGTNGVDGTNGTDGTNGVDGATGATGNNGTNGTNGVDGAAGATGAAGAAGVDGTDGTDGTNALDWMLDQGSSELHPNNYIDTTYSVGDSGLTEKNFTTALESKLNGITSGATVYSDADAVSALSTADVYLKKGESGTITGNLTIDSDFLYIKDQSGTAATRFTAAALTTNRTITLPDESGTLSLGNSTIVTQTSTYWSSATTAYYITLGGGSTSENASLTSSSYSSMYVVPYDGQVKRISSFHQSTSSRNVTLEMYIDGDDSDLVNDQRGSDVTATGITNKFTVDPTDWTFSKGEAIAIRRTDTVGVYGTTMTVVLEFDLTT